MRRSNRMKRILREQWTDFSRPRSNGDGEVRFFVVARGASHEQRHSVLAWSR